MMKYFRDKSVVDHNADLSQIGVTAHPEDSVVVGNFIDRKRPSYQQVLSDLRERIAAQEAVKK